MENFNNLDDVLMHYGVKGMKWGVIRRGSQALSKRKQNKQEANEKYKQDKAAIKAERKAGKISKTTARFKLSEANHERLNKASTTYKSNYSLYKRLGYGEKASRKAAYNDYKSTQFAKVQFTVGLAGLAAPKVASLAGKAYRAVATPENIRRGKNIILAAKRETVRYADPNAVRDVINRELRIGG